MNESETPAPQSSQLAGTIGEALSDGDQRLLSSGILRPRRHAELLLETVLNIDRVTLYLKAREPITPEQKSHYQTLLDRRCAGEPVQYLAGWAPFYDRKFVVGDGVFIPRFDTELLIEQCLEAWDQEQPPETPVAVLDLCCGSGIIGLTLAAERPQARVTLVDKSPEALDFTTRNAVLLGVSDRVEIVPWDVLTDPPPAWQHKFQYLLSNPPYVTLTEYQQLPPDVLREPVLALTDQADGLTFYRHWVKVIPELVAPGGRIFMEISSSIADGVSELYRGLIPDLRVVDDLNGAQRVLMGQVRSQT